MWLIYAATSDGISRLGLGPIFASLGLECFRSHLGFDGSRSRPQAYCIETFNTATKWLSKSFVILRVLCLLYLQVRNNGNSNEKCQKSENISTSMRWC